MDFKQTQPAVNRALCLLKDGLEKGVWKKGDQIPSLVQLAHLFGVSRNSVWRAMQRAKAGGLVSITPRGRITAGRNDGVDESALSDLSQSLHGPIWRKKLERISSDITRGTFSRMQQLPANKELQTLYDVSPATIRKILHALVESGIVHPQRRRYILRMVNSRRASNRAVLLAEGGESGEGLHNPVQYQIVNTLEQINASKQASIEFINLDIFGPMMVSKLCTQLSRQETPAGYLLAVPPAVDHRSLRRIHDLALWLAKRPIPTALFSSSDASAFPGADGSSAIVRMFHPARILCGTQVAQYLLGQGHRNIVYISHVHGNQWSHDRLTGMRRIFTLGGLPDGIQIVTVENIESYHDKNFWLASLEPGQSSLLAEVRQKPSLFKTLLHEVSKGSLTHGWTPGSVQSAKKSIQTLMQLAKINTETRLYASARDALIGEIALNMNNAVFESLFEKALVDRDATAWVAANDGLAIKAIQFLRRKGIRVPEDVAVIGFDNTIEALENGLTSYDFDIPGIVHRMLWFIMRHDVRKEIISPPEDEIAGYVVERGSTRR